MNITKENIEAVLYDYSEGNLSLQEVKEVEKYLDLHPQYKEMLLEYDPSVKVPCDIDETFIQKEEFLRQLVQEKLKNAVPEQQKTVVLSTYIKRISGIAASLLLILAAGSILILQNRNNNAATDNIDIAKTQNNFAKRHSDIEKTPSFDQKYPVFSSKKPPLFDNETTFGKNRKTTGGIEQSKGGDNSSSIFDNSAEDISQTQEYLSQNTIENVENEEINQDNFAVMTSNNDSCLQDDRQEETLGDYEDFEYRIIFFNNKPNVWKRIKNWFNSAKEELFAGN